MGWDVEGQDEGRLQETRRRNAAAASARNGPTTSSRREVSGIAHGYHCPDEQVRRFRGCPSLARGIEDRGQHRYLRIHRYVATMAALGLCFKTSHFGRRGRRRSCRLGMQVALTQLSGTCILHSRFAPKVSVRSVHSFLTPPPSAFVMLRPLGTSSSSVLPPSPSPILHQRRHTCMPSRGQDI